MSEKTVYETRPSWAFNKRPDATNFASFFTLSLGFLLSFGGVTTLTMMIKVFVFLMLISLLYGQVVRSKTKYIIAPPRVIAHFGKLTYTVDQEVIIANICEITKVQTFLDRLAGSATIYLSFPGGNLELENVKNPDKFIAHLDEIRFRSSSSPRPTAVKLDKNRWLR